MSKQITPCEKLGYKVGDKFKVVDGTGVHYAVGSFITLIHDDGSSCPRFNGVHAIFGSGDSFFPLDFVEKVAKLKPAKQALADAINQNGGWVEGGDWHKSGELPPVGAFVDVVGDSLIYGQGESNCEVIAHVENTAVIRMSYGLGCFESGAIIPARTEREKAIDEMVEVLKSAIQDTKTVHKICASALYNAGYRKEVK